MFFFYGLGSFQQITVAKHNLDLNRFHEVLFFWIIRKLQWFRLKRILETHNFQKYPEKMPQLGIKWFLQHDKTISNPFINFLYCYEISKTRFKSLEPVTKFDYHNRINTWMLPECANFQHKILFWRLVCSTIHKAIH